MSQEEPTFSNSVLTFIGVVGAILTFALIIFVAYLPNLPAPADQKANEDRQAAADEARAAGAAKLQGYEVLNKDGGVVRIPIEEAKALTLKAYQ
jgi:hypothetical protein